MTGESFEHLELRCGERVHSAVGAGSGPLVLLLHGFPDSYRSFDAQLPAIAAAGYRAVAVAMRGYQAGCQPADGAYSGAALGQDAIGFLDALGEDRAHLIGHDWGAVAGYAAAAGAPERFASLTAIGVPHSGRFLAEISRHPRQLRRSWYMGFFQLPRLPEGIIRRRDFAFLRWLWRQWSPGWSFSDEDFAPVHEAFSEAGVVESALAYYRSAVDLRKLASPSGSSAGFDVPVPTLGLTGERDGCIGADAFEAMCREEDFSRGLRVERIENAGHFLHREAPEVVNQRLLDWIARHD